LVDLLDEKAPDYQEQRDKLAPLLQSNFAKGVQVTELEDMLAVLKNEKVLYTESGEKALTFDQADYILGADQVIVKRNDKLYLIKKGQSFDDMSIEEQERAANNYKSTSKEEIMGIKKLINQYNKQEIDEASKHTNALSQRSELMQQDILLIANQLAEMQSAASNAELSLKKQPTPTPGSKMTAAPCTSTYYSDSYKHMLCLMKSNPTSEQSIDRLKYITSRVDYSPELKKEINSLKPGIPIPPQIMNRLLAIKDFGTNWLDVRKPDRVTLDTTPPGAPKVESKTAPSPFPMSPFKG
jgi:NACalpha-BTF3-like transcription factor